MVNVRTLRISSSELAQEFSRHCVFSLATIMLLTSSSQAQQAPRPVTPVAPAGQVQRIAPETIVILIRASIIALGQANTTNNYTVLSALGSRSFRTNNPPPRLATVFKSFRDNRIDLTPVVFLNPQLTKEPSIQNGKMRLVGSFASKPMQVNFDLMFEPDEGVWKLADLGVNLSGAR
jgi:hypothetical protein